MYCALCNHSHLTSVATKDAKTGAPLGIRLCRSCGLIQQNPLPTEQQLSDYYATSYRIDYKGTWHPKPKHIHRAARCAASRLQQLAKSGVRGGTLLDIGAGGGEFVALARQSGFDACGIEPNQGYAEYARMEYQVPVTTAGLDEVTGRYGIITLFHVLEHLRLPLEVFERLHSLLEPDGVLFIEVPWALSGAIAPSNRYFKAHLYYFDVRTLTACASRHFEVFQTSVDGNLRMLLRPRPVVAPIALPPPDYAASLPALLRRHGWIHYLTHGRGFTKLFRKASRWWEESRVQDLPGRKILKDT